MEFVDIAGLVSGASRGEGLGNQFLANIRETEAIAHVVRCFDDDDVMHVSNTVDPATDIEVINTELALADLDTIEKAEKKGERAAKGGDKTAKAQLALFEKIKPVLNEGNPVRSMDLSDDDHELLRELHLLTAKPTVYIANVNEEGFENNPHLDAVRAIAEKEDSGVVAICNKIEAEIAELEDEEKPNSSPKWAWKSPAWTASSARATTCSTCRPTSPPAPRKSAPGPSPKGSTAPKAAGVIHTDFEKGFIRAEVVSYEDFIAYNGESGAKEAGKWRLEGKEYIVQDGDVIHFRFNV